MTAAVLACALSTLPIEVSHRRVTPAVTVVRYRLEGVTSRLAPVVVVPDFGFRGTVAAGLAQWLTQRGFDVYVVDSAEPVATIADTMLEPVLAAVDAPAVDLIVHGWRGAVVLEQLGTVHRSAVRRVVALSVPVLPTQLTEAVDVFLARGARLSHLATQADGPLSMEILFGPPSLFPATVDFTRAGAPELRTFMVRGPRADALRAYDSPTLALIALGDAFAPPESCARAREMFGGPVSLRVLTSLDSGSDFSHVELFTGPDARTIVYPAIEAHLRGVTP